MAYTSYPREARSFYNKVKTIDVNLRSVSNTLKQIPSILTIGSKEDYLTTKTIGLNNEIIKIIDREINSAYSESSAVTAKANELEIIEEERQKKLAEEALKKIKEDNVL